jgi:hypothetical protein
LLASDLTAEPGWLTFDHVADRAHLDALESALQPPGVELGDGPDEALL